MTDARCTKLAKVLVDYSVDVQKGDNVLVDAIGVDYMLVNEIIKEVYARGGRAYLNCIDPRMQRALLMGATDEQLKVWSDYDEYRMKKMQCYIGIRGGGNSFENSDVPSDRLASYSRIYAEPVHHDIRVKKTKWVILRYPTEGFSQLSGMSTEAFEDFYFDVCTLDYGRMDRAMDALKARMERTDRVRIVAKDTDLTFSIKGMNAVKCSGNCNIPDGEIYTAPLRESVSGKITYNAPSIHDGVKFDNVSLTFDKGRIVKAEGSHPELLEKVFDTDPGARYVGEFALGVNPYIHKATGDILFDEKISGSIHFTPGSCYEDADNGNHSAIHWDLVLIQTPEFGGGEIWFDDELIRKDGLFVTPDLACLNPDALK